MTRVALSSNSDLVCAVCDLITLMMSFCGKLLQPYSRSTCKETTLMSKRFTNNILRGLDTSQATNLRLHRFPRPFPRTISTKIVCVYFILSARGSLTTFHKVHLLQTTDFPAFPKLFPCTPLRFSTVHTSRCQQVVYLQRPTRFRHTTDHRFPHLSKAFSMHHFH